MVSRYSADVVFKPRSIWSMLGTFSGSVAASAVWPNANQAFYIRLRNLEAFTPSHAFVLNGATAAGNIDIGFYGSDYERIASTGAFAQAGTTQYQFEAFTTKIPAGEIILAISFSLGTATFRAGAITSSSFAGQVRAFEGAQQTSAHALPSTMVPANPTDFTNGYPVFGFTDLLD